MSSKQLKNTRAFDCRKWLKGYVDSEQSKPTEVEVKAFCTGYNMAWKRQQNRLTKESLPPQAENIKR